MPDEAAIPGMAGQDIVALQIVGIHRNAVRKMLAFSAPRGYGSRLRAASG